MAVQGQNLVKLFRQFVDSDDLPAAVTAFAEFRQHLNVNEQPSAGDGDQQQQLQQQGAWTAIGQQVGCNEAKTLCKCLTARASHVEYDSQSSCSNTSVLIVGGGPCGLRAAIECCLLGARRVVVVESRDYISRNNILYLWPLVMSDLKSIGAKVFYSKFGTGSIDHISTRRLQLLLLKIALVCGAEIHAPVKFQSLVEPDPAAGHGWKAMFSGAATSSSQLEDYEFDVVIGADGKLNTVPGFKRKLFRGKMAIAITANFVNRGTPVENRVNEISGLAYIFHQEFFNDLKASTGIELENFVYYKGDTHYFVMTPKKSCLLRKGILKKDFTEPTQLLSTDNVDVDGLKAFVREAVSCTTKLPISTLPFATTHHGEDDIAIFDFTALHQAEHSSYIQHRHGHDLLLCVVGDTLLEPFWPIGSGVARGFLGVFDAAWLIRGCAINGRPSLDQIAERESVYQLLSQAKPDNMNKKLTEYTIDPRTRYGRLTNMKSIRVDHVKQLYVNCDDAVRVVEARPVPKPRGVVKFEADSASPPAASATCDDTKGVEMALKAPQPAPGGKSPVIGRRKAPLKKQQLIDTLRATLTTSLGGLSKTLKLKRKGGVSFVKQSNTEQQQQQHIEQKMDDRIEQLLATLRVLPCHGPDTNGGLDVNIETSSQSVHSTMASDDHETRIHASPASEISDQSKRTNLRGDVGVNDSTSQQTDDGIDTSHTAAAAAAAAAAVTDDDSDLDDADIDETYRAALLALKNTISSKMVELDDLVAYQENLSMGDDDTEQQQQQQQHHIEQKMDDRIEQLLATLRVVPCHGPDTTAGLDVNIEASSDPVHSTVTSDETHVHASSASEVSDDSKCTNLHGDVGINDGTSQQTDNGTDTSHTAAAAAAAAAASVTDEDSDLDDADIDESYRAALLALKNTISSKKVELDDLVAYQENMSTEDDNDLGTLTYGEAENAARDDLELPVENLEDSGDRVQDNEPELPKMEPQTIVDVDCTQVKQRFNEAGQQLKDWLDAINGKICDPKIDRQSANAFKSRLADLRQKHMNVFAHIDLLTDINEDDCRELDEDIKYLSGEISDLQEFVNLQQSFAF